jgi:hypothetical protein
MKQSIAFLLGLALVTSAFAHQRTIAHSTNYPAGFEQQDFKILTMDSSISVANYTPIALGVIGIALDDQSSVYITVTGGGLFGMGIDHQPVLCTIDGQSLVPNSVVTIRVDAHTTVRASWGSTSVIVVDNLEIN